MGLLKIDYPIGKELSRNPLRTSRAGDQVR
jgi:hypothetical protein